MNLDFPLILVLLTLVTGLIWALDALFWSKGREQRADALRAKGVGEDEVARQVKEPGLVDLSRSFFPIILLVLVVRSFVAEPFRIPSGSMMPTLLVGDFILVNKFSYGLRLPVLNTRFLSLGEPQRGDVMVFRYPEDPRVDYIKRVIGVPGDHIRYQGKQLTINGELATQQLGGVFVGEGSESRMTGARRMRENLLGLEYDILVMPHDNMFLGDFEFVVPQGQYFTMGDNRDNSRDSRAWGTVPEENLVGKAFLIWMSWDWSKEKVIAWDRLGSRIQ
ncbi:MAG: signal peptidase I [Chromatiales bacterium]|nr:signal peptidase I [Chromatiales bacterium]